MKSITTNLEFTCSNNKCEASTNKLDFKGEVREGKVKLFNDGKVSICIENETYAAYKNAATDEVTVAKGTCNYSGDEYTVDELVSLSDFNDMKAQYEAQISTLEEQLENSSKTDLLWTNPNPNAEFAAQTVSLDLTNYSKIVVYAQNVTYPTLYQNAYYVLDKNNTAQVIRGGIQPWWFVRTATPSNTGITFTIGHCANNGGMSGSDGNGYVVPINIYGIK